jgi:hypothetical protein
MTHEEGNEVVLTKDDIDYFINNNMIHEKGNRQPPINCKKNKYYKLKKRTKKLIEIFKG